MRLRLAFAALLVLGGCGILDELDPEPEMTDEPEYNSCAASWELLDDRAAECGVENPLGELPPASLCSPETQRRALCQGCCLAGFSTLSETGYPTCDDLGPTPSDAALFCAFACYEDPRWMPCDMAYDALDTPCQNDMHQVLVRGWVCGVEPPVPYTTSQLAECTPALQEEVACLAACREGPDEDICANVRPPEGGGPSFAETCSAACLAGG